MSTKPAVQSMPREQAPAQYQEANERRYRNQVDDELLQKFDKRSNLTLGRGKSLILTSASGGVAYSLSLSDAGILTVTNAATGDTADIILEWDGLNGVPANLAVLDGTEGINNALVPAFGANIIRSTHFPSTAKWQIASNDTGLPTTLSRFTDSNNEAYLQAQATGTTSGVRVIYIANSETINRVNVTAGQRYEFGVDLFFPAATGAYSEFLIFWRDAAGSTIGSQISLGTNTTGGSWNRITAFATAPANAASVLIGGRVVTASAHLNPFIALRRPFLSRARTEQTTFTPYIPGAESDLNSDVTAANIAAGIVGQGALATLNTIPAADKTVSKQNLDLDIDTSGTTWIVGPTFDMTVGASGFLTCPLASLYAGVGMVLSAGTTFAGNWRITEATQADPTTKTVVWSGTFTADSSPDVTGFVSPLTPIANTKSGACRYTLEVQRASGTNNVSNMASFLSLTWTPSG